MKPVGDSGLRDSGSRFGVEYWNLGLGPTKNSDPLALGGAMSPRRYEILQKTGQHQNLWSNYNDVVATWSKRTKVGKKSVFPNEIFGCQIGSY